MAGGSSGGADIEGRAFDAGPVGQNVSAASIGQAQGKTGLEAVAVGMKELGKLDAKHGTNFTDKALGLTSNNSIGVSELEGLGFDPEAPIGSDQVAALDAQVYGLGNATAQNTGSNFSSAIDNALKHKVFPAVTNTTWDVYDEQDRKIESMLQQGLISVDEANQMKGHHLSQQGFLSPLVNALQSPWQMYDQVMDDKNNRPNVSIGQSIIDGFKAGYNNLLGMDYGPQVENKEALDAYLDMIGQPRTSSGVLSQGGIPNVGAQYGPSATLYGGHIGANNIGHGFRVGPFGYGYLDLDVDPDATWGDEGWNVNPVDVQSLGSFDFGLDSAPMSYDQSAAFDRQAISGAGGEALQEAIAQRVAENIIRQEAVSTGSSKVEIPVSGGPNIVIDVTPPEPQVSVAPHRRTPPPPSPVSIAAKTVAKPKAFKKLPTFAKKSLRKGKVPKGGSDYVQDMVSAFLAPPAPVRRGPVR